MKKMTEIIRQKISNHHINNDIERYVIIRRIADNADVSQIVISGHVEYFKDGQNITSTFKKFKKFSKKINSLYHKKVC